MAGLVLDCCEGAFSSCGEQGLLSGCSARASHHPVSSRCRAWALGCGLWGVWTSAQALGCVERGLWGMWGVGSGACGMRALGRVGLSVGSGACGEQALGCVGLSTGSGVCGVRALGRVECVLCDVWNVGSGACGARALGHVGLSAGFGVCGARALGRVERGLWGMWSAGSGACGARAQSPCCMRDFPDQKLNWWSPAFQGGFLTT